MASSGVDDASCVMYGLLSLGDRQAGVLALNCGKGGERKMWIVDAVIFF